MHQLLKSQGQKVLIRIMKRIINNEIFKCENCMLTYENQVTFEDMEWSTLKDCVVHAWTVAYFAGGGLLEGNL